MLRPISEGAIRVLGRSAVAVSRLASLGIEAVLWTTLGLTVQGCRRASLGRTRATRQPHSADRLLEECLHLCLRAAGNCRLEAAAQAPVAAAASDAAFCFAARIYIQSGILRREERRRRHIIRPSTVPERRWEMQVASRCDPGSVDRGQTSGRVASRGIPHAHPRLAMRTTGIPLRDLAVGRRRQHVGNGSGVSIVTRLLSQGDLLALVDRAAPIVGTVAEGQRSDRSRHAAHRCGRAAGSVSVADHRLARGYLVRWQARSGWKCRSGRSSRRGAAAAGRGAGEQPRSSSTQSQCFRCAHAAGDS